MKHGTITGYFGLRCRCDECRTAATAYERDRRAKVSAGIPRRAYGQSRHGTVAHYQNRGCRCDECRAARSRYDLERKAQRRVSS